MNNKIIIGTRGSKLALWQAEFVQSLIKIKKPNFNIKIKIIKTTGDINKNKPLVSMNSKGVFIKEIEDALLNNEIDIAVHSLKDMPTENTPSLSLTAYCKRDEPNDAIIINPEINSEKFKTGLLVGSGSLRRINQFKNLFPDCKFKNIRGNVETRIQKVIDNKYDATILSLSGLKRLNLTKHISRIFKVTEMVPAPGQGVICIQTKNNNEKLNSIVKLVNDEITEKCVFIERTCLKKLEGGCSVPFGIYCNIYNNKISVYCYLSDTENIKVIRKKYEFNMKNYNKIPDIIVNDLMKIGADKIVEQIKTNLK